MSNEEIIEDFIDELREFVLTKETLEVVNALKDILLERKQDKERIEELEEINKKYIVQLTDEQYRNLVDRIRKESKQEFEQKVIDKMEKLNKEIKNGDEIEAIFKIKQQQILEELLEGK